MRRRTLAALALAASLLPAAAAAQFQQYTEPGSLAERRERRAEAVQRRAEEARWSLGRLRLAPELGLTDTGYVDNVYDANDDAPAESDFRTTAVAGLEAFLNLGPKAIVNLYGRPHYVWWQDQDELRVFNVGWGAGLYGDFNRLQTELVASHAEEQGYLSNELRVPLDLERDEASFAFDVDLYGPLALFGAAATARIRLPEATPEGATPIDLAPLDRDETVFSAGLEYALGNGLRLGAGAERSRAEFDVDPGGRSNEGTSPMVRLLFEGNRAELDAAAVWRRLEFDNPAIGDVEETTGTLRTHWQLGTRSDLAVFGSRQIVYSALDAGSFFTSTVYGAAVGWGRPEPRRPRLRLLAETGTDAFEGAGGALAGREDDVVSYGVLGELPWRRLLVFELGFIASDIDSNQDPFDRSLATVRLGITLRPVGIGQPRGDA